MSWPSWYSLPVYGFAAMAIASILLRDKWLFTAASLLVADTIACSWIIGHVDPHCAWAYKAICDLFVATALAWPMRIKGLVVAVLLGINVTFYLLIGASEAFGNAWLQAHIAYDAWWGMEYLAFVICGALAVIGLDDHGGKAVRSHIARYSRRNRRSVLEGHVAHSQAPYSGVAHAETVDGIHTALERLYRLD